MGSAFLELSLTVVDTDVAADGVDSPPPPSRGCSDAMTGTRGEGSVFAALHFVSSRGGATRFTARFPAGVGSSSPDL